MIPAIRESRLFPVLFFIAMLFIFFIFPVPASALTEVEINPVNTPQGAVVLIVDGMSAPFIYPELTPHALDGNSLEKAKLETLQKINKESVRLLEFCAPQTFTEGGHSVLVTGNLQKPFRYLRTLRGRLGLLKHNAHVLYRVIFVPENDILLIAD